MTSSISISLDSDGIATLLLDLSGSPVNVFTEQSLEDFSKAIDQCLNDSSIKGVVIASSKPVFHVGADLDMALKLAELPPQDLYDRILSMHQVMRRMETADKPFVTAIEGHAMGGGLELAMACHARIVESSGKIQLSLPESKLGLMPGFGGTQRLARMLPIMEALPALMTGKTFRPEKAKKIGLVTVLAAPGETREVARKWALSNPNAKQPWDQSGAKFPAGPVHSASNLQVFAGASAQLRQNSYGNYPAIRAILDSVYHGLQMPIDQALKVETRHFVSVARSDVAQNMIKTLFFQMNDANALKRRPQNVAQQSYNTIGIVGAGLMGAGLAYQAAKVGLNVVLLDQTKTTADKGRAYSEPLLAKAVKRGSLTPDSQAAHLSRIKTTTEYSDLKICNVVVEAVFESKPVKKTVLQAIESVVSQDCLIASNTSTIPISELAQYVSRPDRFIGLHFFSPVEKMPLLEIISGNATSEQTLARSFDLAQRLKKTPIDVNDGRAFFTTRVVSSYMTEGMAMLIEGVNPALIEKAGLMAGMPMGPLRLADLVNLDLSVKIADQARDDLGESFEEPSGLQAARDLVALERLGEKVQAGFYDHRFSVPRLWPDLNRMFPVSDDQPQFDYVKDRLLAIQAVETLRCVDEGVLKTKADANLGSILGWGFAPFTGGIASYIEDVGKTTLTERLTALEKCHGQRFSVPNALENWG